MHTKNLQSSSYATFAIDPVPVYFYCVRVDPHGRAGPCGSVRVDPHGRAVQKYTGTGVDGKSCIRRSLQVFRTHTIAVPARERNPAALERPECRDLDSSALVSFTLR